MPGNFSRYRQDCVPFHEETSNSQQARSTRPLSRNTEILRRTPTIPILQSLVKMEIETVRLSLSIDFPRIEFEVAEKLKAEILRHLKAEIVRHLKAEILRQLDIDSESLDLSIRSSENGLVNAMVTITDHNYLREDPDWTEKFNPTNLRSNTLMLHTLIAKEIQKCNIILNVPYPQTAIEIASFKQNLVAELAEAWEVDLKRIHLALITETSTNRTMGRVTILNEGVVDDHALQLLGGRIDTKSFYVKLDANIPTPVTNAELYRLESQLMDDLTELWNVNSNRIVLSIVLSTRGQTFHVEIQDLNEQNEKSSQSLYELLTISDLSNFGALSTMFKCEPHIMNIDLNMSFPETQYGMEKFEHDYASRVGGMLVINPNRIIVSISPDGEKTRANVEVLQEEYATPPKPRSMSDCLVNGLEAERIEIRRFTLRLGVSFFHTNPSFQADLRDELSDLCGIESSRISVAVLPSMHGTVIATVRIRQSEDMNECCNLFEKLSPREFRNWDRFRILSSIRGKEYQDIDIIFDTQYSEHEAPKFRIDLVPKVVEFFELPSYRIHVMEVRRFNEKTRASVSISEGKICQKCSDRYWMTVNCLKTKFKDWDLRQILGSCIDYHKQWCWGAPYAQFCEKCYEFRQVLIARLVHGKDIMGSFRFQELCDDCQPKRGPEALKQENHSRVRRARKIAKRFGDSIKKLHYARKVIYY